MKSLPKKPTLKAALVIMSSWLIGWPMLLIAAMLLAGCAGSRPVPIDVNAISTLCNHDHDCTVALVRAETDYRIARVESGARVLQSAMSQPYCGFYGCAPYAPFFYPPLWRR